MPGNSKELKKTHSNCQSTDGEQSYVLGIDVGTTSVKVCLVDTFARSIVALQAKETQANVPSEFGTEGNKQDVPKISSTIHNCVARLPRDILKRVVYIGICGQMHGVLLWKQGEGWVRNGDKLEPKSTSNLYTWQDSRCSKEFIASLPKPDSNLVVSSGYGCATLFWMARNQPEKIQKYDRAGTIQDFVVAMICDLQFPIMSVQNAAGWGYFDIEKKEWNTEILSESDFPVHLLPKIVFSGLQAGNLSSTWHNIPEGTPVGAALGDFQCSVYSTLQNDDQAVLNISTSAQLAFQMKEGFAPSSIREVDALPDIGNVQFIPYFRGRYLAVAAALTGGNSLAAFVRMLQQWCIDLGCNVPQSKIWEKILAAGDNPQTKSKLEIVPTIFGERHFPDGSASVSNIDLGNISLGQVTRALCRGIILNLHEMMPTSILEEAGITSVIGSGSALSRNPILQQEFQEIYQLETQFGKGGDAALGAALSVLYMYNLEKE